MTLKNTSTVIKEYSDINNAEYYNWILRMIRSLMFNCVMVGFTSTMAITYLYSQNKIGFVVCGLTSVVTMWAAYKTYSRFEAGK